MGISTRSSASKICVGNDLYAPLYIEVTSSAMEDVGADHVAVLLLEGVRYVVHELRITRRDGGAAITSELIRGIPVGMIVRGAVRNLVGLRREGVEYEAGGVSLRAPEQVVITPKERKRLIAAGPTDETLLYVARIYVMAELAGDPPAKSVREALGIPTSTAGYWVRRAKDRGLLAASNVKPGLALENYLLDEASKTPSEEVVAQYVERIRVRHLALERARERMHERQRKIDSGEIT